MAWNEPGGDNQNPWGGKRGGNQGPPDLDEVFRKLSKALGSLFGLGGASGGRGGSSGSGLSASLLSVIFLVAAALYLWNAIYVVDERERAVILRLGQYVETVGPGLRMYFPPIESRYKRPVTQINTYRLSQAMLTEDENIVEVAMSVQYNISSLENYVLKDANPEQSLREATQSALRHVVGGSRMYKVLTEGREVLGEEIKARLQEYLNVYGSGLNVVKVNIESSQPPRQVLAAFDDVIRAREEEQQEKNKAEAFANQIVPEARGDARRVIEEAQAYRQESVARAEGDAARFSQLLAEYQKAPAVTRERLYLETMQTILGSTSKVLVDVKGGNNLMYLPLDKLMDASKSGKNEEDSGSAASMSQEDINTLTDQVTSEINKRVSRIRKDRSAP